MLRLRRYSSTSYSVESVLKHVRNKKPIQDKEIEDYSGVRMLLPPPNVTGKLHLGHGLTITIQDTLNRLSRLRGEKPIWFPGLDHAGISVQSVVEKELWKGSNLKRIHLSREHFVGECNKWKDLKTEQISSQIKKMGAAIDWSHQYYTMDDTFSSGVGKAFVQLHQDGYIFRDKRMINWCPTLQSSISDQEVSTISVTAGDSITIPSNGIKRNVKFGRLFKVKYELADCSFQKFVQVETSRPETIFADVALAVNPSDDRYTKLIGLDVINPLTGKRMKIVTNEEVKIEFGTGVLKLTPNHSQIDFKIVTKCIEEGVLSKDLMSINCIDEQGKMVITSNHSSLNGLDRFEAREQVINLLSSQDKLIESTKQGYKTEIPVCERSGDVIEPVLKEQWFMRTASLHQQIKEHLKKGNLRIFPEFHKENLNQWLNNEDPWCLSRQLWWGHQIPAYFDADSNKWIVTDQENKVNKRDEDVLDTWFSSGLIPAILGGWPTNKKPLQMSFLETGHDILGFWVARMLLLNLALTKELPFTKVYLHGLVRDEQGRKMSKSLGNVIDPLDVIEGITLGDMIKRNRDSSLNENEIILSEQHLRKKYPEGIKAMGADALRFAFLKHDMTGVDVNMDVNETVTEGYKFCNKLWNVSKFAKISFDSVAPDLSSADQLLLKDDADVMNIWIKNRLGRVLKSYQDNLVDDFKPNAAFNSLHIFILNDFCDVYLECTKIFIKSDDSTKALKASTYLLHNLQNTLTSLSIFMPDISSYLLDQLGSYGANSPILMDQLIQSNQINNASDDSVDLFKRLTSSINKIKSEFTINKVRCKGVLRSSMGESSVADEFTKLIPLLDKSLNFELIVNNGVDVSNHISFNIPGTSYELYVEVDDQFKEKILLKKIEKKRSMEKKALKYFNIHEKFNSYILKNDASPEKLKEWKGKSESALTRYNAQLQEINLLDLSIKELKSTI